MARPEKITPALIAAHSNNRATIDRANQEQLFAIRRRRDAEKDAMCAQLVAEANAEQRPFDMAAYERECRRINDFYWAQERPFKRQTDARSAHQAADLRLWDRV